MKILIDQLADMNAEHVRSVQELAKEHEIVYWIRIENTVPLDKSLFPSTIFHDYLDAVKNIPPKEIDTSSFEPWGRDEIVKLAAWEAELMSMMDKGHSEWPINRRKHFYYELLQYWGGILDIYKPDLVLFNAPPHQVFNFVLFAIAKHRGIRTIVFDEVIALGRVISCHDYREGNQKLANWKNYKTEQDASSPHNLPEYLHSFYEKVSRHADPTPEDLIKFKKATVPLKNLKRRIYSLVPYFIDGSILERGTRRFFKMLKPSLEETYRRYQRDADFEKPYIYLALHYQPECTTSPQGGIYVEQIQMIATLAASLPVGWELYVKEHPAQWPSHWGDYIAQRYPEFYEEISKIPHVRIVPIKTNTFRLEDGARATATVSGTVALESILRGKCAIIFGYPWFMHAPGILRVSSVEGCRNAIAKVESGEAKPIEQDIIRYLSCFDEVSFKGSLSSPGELGTPSNAEIQWKGMLGAISDELSN